MNKLTHPAACMRVLFYVIIAIHEIPYRIAGFRHDPHHRGRPPARKAGCSTPVRLDHQRK